MSFSPAWAMRRANPAENTTGPVAAVEGLSGMLNPVAVLRPCFSPPQKNSWVDSGPKYAQAFVFDALTPMEVRPEFGREIHACSTLRRDGRAPSALGRRPSVKGEVLPRSLVKQASPKASPYSGGDASMRTDALDCPSGRPAPPIRPGSTHRFPRRAISQEGTRN